MPVLLAVGWGPLFIAGLLYPHDWKVGEGFGMGWGFVVALPSTALCVLSAIAQGFRLIAYLISRPSSK
jgi:hypothetical protein